MRWLMNMPVDPAKTDEWEAWVRSRHPDEAEEAVAAHLAEWRRFLSGKVTGSPKAQAKTREDYTARGWVGIYQPSKANIQIEGEDYIVERRQRQIRAKVKVRRSNGVR